jgi:hypothetical protein
MKNPTLTPRLWVVVSMITAAGVLRALPHPPNFTPIAALALFGGAHLASRRLAFLVPLAAMLLGDLIIGLHGLLPVIYGCFVVTVGLGLFIRGRLTPSTVGGAALASSILFFVTTNLAVWAQGEIYPRTLEGLGRCYLAAIPFFRNTLAGDAFYVVSLFGGFALAQWLYPLLRDPELAAPSRA